MIYIKTTLVFLLGLLGSGLLAWHQSNYNRDQAQTALSREAASLETRLRQRFQLYEYGLRGARGVVLVTDGQPGRALFRRYAQSRDTDKEFPGARGFGFIRRVPPAQLDDFLAQARADGKPDFAIRQLTPTTGERFVIQYIEPIERNLPAVGLDIRSETNRRIAAETAMQTGLATLTGPITLVQKTGEQQRSLLFLLPVYKPEAPTHTTAQRMAACIGWTYTPLSLKEVLSDFSLLDRGLEVVLKDVTSRAEGEIFFDALAASADKTDLKAMRSFDHFGRRWQLHTVAQKAFLGHLHQPQPLTIFGQGAVVSFMLAALLGLMLAATERKRASQEQRAQLAAIVEHSPDAIIGESMDGRILSWNQSAEALFGHAKEDVIGRPLAQVFLAPGQQYEDADLLRRIGEGQAIPPFDAIRVDKEGRPIDVSIAAGAIRAEDGRLIGIAKLVRDIRARKEAERQLKEFNLTLEDQIHARTAELETARRDLRNVLDAVPSMIGYWDRELRNRFANKAYVEWFGKRPQDILGQHIADLLGEKNFHANLPFIEAVLQGQSQRFERVMETPTGPRHALVNYLPDERDGSVMGFYVIVHDLTEIMESRMHLAREQERTASIIAGTRTGTWEWDLPSGELRVNDEWVRIIGHGEGEARVGSLDAWLDMIHPDDRPRLEEALRRNFRREQDHFECESRIRHKDGHWLWVLDRGQALDWDEEGRPRRIHGTHQSIDAFKAVQAEAFRMGSLFDSVLRAATSVSVIATDVTGTITVFNAGAQQMLGYEAEEMIGRSTPAPLHLASEVADRSRELSETYGTPVEGFRAFVHVAEIEGSETRQWTYVRKDGSRLTVQLTVTAVRSEQGEIVGYLGIAQDITERLRQEEALRQAKAAAEAANAAKSMFLANMSHEIRTPMNAVIGAAYLLESSKLDSDQRQLLRKVQVAGRSLLGIINDVLDLAKIEAGEVLIESAPFSPSEVLDDVEQLFAEQAAAKGIAFQIVGRASLPPQLKGDALRLKQILVNLSSNAIKFTKEGSVMIWVQQEGTSTHPLWLRWSVRDTGVGIAPEMLDQLFKPFTQADASTTRRYGGTGLGLSIVKQLAEMMGGEAGAQSVPSRGSEFWVKLPFDVGDVAEGEGVQTGALSLAVVDDVAADRRIIGGMCRTLGWRVTELASGQALLDMCANLVETAQPLPDAVLVDWDMPGMDGFQTLAALTDQVGAQRLPGVLLITAHERARLQEMEASGLADDILLKPATPSELFNAVNASVARRTGNMDRVTRSTKLVALEGNWLQDMRILLVDDSDINLDVGRRLLEREGARVRTCTDGQQALDALRSEPDQFDVVLMDIQMPVMDGYTATIGIRKELGLTRLPVLALTAGALSEERRKAEAAGMDDFLTKPLEPSSLIRAVRRAVEHRQGMPLALPVGSARIPPPPVGHWPIVTGIDANAAALRLSGDVQLFQKMLMNLCKEFKGEQWRREAGAPTAPVLEAWGHRLHKLKGTAGLLGANEIQALATEAERLLAQSADPEAARSTLKALADELDALTGHVALAFGSSRGSPTVEASHAAAPVPSAGQVAALRSRLQRQDMSALDLSRPVLAYLDAQGEALLARELEATLDELDFKRADGLLAQRFASPAGE